MIPSQSWLSAHGLTENEYLSSDVLAPISGGQGDGSEGNNLLSQSIPGGTPPKPPSLYDLALRDFRKNLTGTNQSLLDYANKFGQMAEGNDPLLESQRQAATQQLNDEFARRGIFGGALLNEQAKVNSQYDLQNAGLSDQRRLQSADLLQARQQNLLAVPTMETARLAASNAGKSTGGGKK